MQSLSLSCSAQEAPANSSTQEQFYSQLQNLNRRILLKDIELERFNVRFRSASSVQGRWRGPRYFLSQETNAAATMAGLWGALAVREEPIQHPLILNIDKKGKLTETQRAPSRIGIEETILPQLVGQGAGALGSAIELGINYFHDSQAKRKGLDRPTASKHVEGIKKEMAALFAERNALLASNASIITPAQQQLTVLEGNVLKDLCDLALNEYARFHISTHRNRTLQDSLYIIDVARNVVGIAGNVVALNGTQVRRRSYNGTAGILTFSSGFLALANPIASRLAGKIVSMHDERQLQKLQEGTEECDLAKLETDRAKLAELIKSSQSDSQPDALFTQTIQLDALNQLDMQDHKKKLELALREVRAGTRAATENITVGALVGGSKMVLGITVMISGFRYYNRAIQSNNIIAAGLMTYGIGSSLAVGENIRIQAMNEINRRKLSRNNQLPSQIFAEHLKELDAIESRLAFH